MANRAQSVIRFSAAMLILAATAAEARDLCINPNIRLSRFKLPARGQCLPAAGTSYTTFVPPGGHYDRVGGTVCTRSDGTALFLELTLAPDTHGSDDILPQIYSITISLPSLTYLYRAYSLKLDFTSGSGQAAYCSKVPIP